jgi:threonine/homoserine/homoserine lactone efflux protein
MTVSAYALVLLRAAILGFSVAAPLGPTGATAIRRGLSSGAWAAFWVGMGAALTDFVYFGLTYAGLAPILLKLPFLKPILYMAGAVVLGRMGIGAIREAIENRLPSPVDSAAADASPPAETWRSALLLGITVTIVNPATITSWLSIGGAFTATYLDELSVVEAFGAMLAVFIGSVVWWVILAGVVGVARASIGRLPWLFRGVAFGSGLMLVAFAMFFGWGAIDYVAG